MQSSEGGRAPSSSLRSLSSSSRSPSSSLRALISSKSRQLVDLFQILLQEDLSGHPRPLGRNGHSSQGAARPRFALPGRQECSGDLQGVALPSALLGPRGGGVLFFWRRALREGASPCRDCPAEEVSRADGSLSRGRVCRSRCSPVCFCTSLLCPPIGVRLCLSAPAERSEAGRPLESFRASPAGPAGAGGIISSSAVLCYSFDVLRCADYPRPRLGGDAHVCHVYDHHVLVFR